MQASPTSRCSGRPDERIRSGCNAGRTSVRPYNKDALREDHAMFEYALRKDHAQLIHCATSRVARRIGSPRVAGTAGFIGAELARPDATTRKAQLGWMARPSRECVARGSRATYSLRQLPGNLTYRVHPGVTGGRSRSAPTTHGSAGCTWRTIRRGRTCSTQRHNPENATSPVGAELARPGPVTTQKPRIPVPVTTLSPAA